jgi:3-hydroxymyristoyl/3-hydroxydecanoyl-(acyl carrier protein) dehydratase
MVLEVEVIQRKSNIWKCAGSARVDEALCAEAELLAAIVDREDGGGG